MFEDKDSDAINDLQFVEPHVFGFCSRSGFVGMVDLRTKEKLQWEKQLHEKKVGILD